MVSISRAAPDASRMCKVAAMISGPMPSPCATVMGVLLDIGKPKHKGLRRVTQPQGDRHKLKARPRRRASFCTILVSPAGIGRQLGTCQSYGPLSLRLALPGCPCNMYLRHLQRRQHAVENLQFIQTSHEIRAAAVGWAVGADAQRHVIKEGTGLGGNGYRRIGLVNRIKIPKDGRCGAPPLDRDSHVMPATRGKSGQGRRSVVGVAVRSVAQLEGPLAPMRSGTLLRRVPVWVGTATGELGWLTASRYQRMAAAAPLRWTVTAT